MGGLFLTFQVAIACLCITGVTFLILLALPQSQLRSVMGRTMKYLTAIVLGLLVVSPVDILPDVVPVFGWGDDLAYLAGAVAAIYSARKDRNGRLR